MHLHGNVLDNYVRRDLPAETLDAIDRHVSNCLSCAHTLASGTAASPAGNGGACLDASSATSTVTNREPGRGGAPESDSRGHGTASLAHPRSARRSNPSHRRPA